MRRGHPAGRAPSPCWHTCRSQDSWCAPGRTLWPPPLGERHWPVPPALRSEPASHSFPPPPCRHRGPPSRTSVCQSPSPLSGGAFPSGHDDRGPAGVISQELSGPAKVTLCTAHGAVSGDPSLGSPVPVTLRGSLDGDASGGHPDETEGELGPGGGSTASSSPPPPSLSLPPVSAAALTLQQTPLGQRLRQKRSKQALTQPWTEGAGEAASTHWDGVSAGGGHANDLAAPESPAQGLQ